jgi:ABC-type glutathione transport system ATPase component
MHALQAKNLMVGARLDGGIVPAVRGLTFDLPPGKILGLVGESGAGKSMIGRAVAQAGRFYSRGRPLWEWRQRADARCSVARSASSLSIP